MLIVQVVEIFWTKATRGAPRAYERAVLPRAFSIEPCVGEYALQCHVMRERHAFRPCVAKTEVKPSVPGSEGMLRIARRDDGGFVLGLMSTCGQPRRHGAFRALTLLQGQWARLMVNARHTSYSGQYYTETHYNVACGPHIPADRFLQGLPDHELDLKAHLF